MAAKFYFLNTPLIFRHRTQSPIPPPASYKRSHFLGYTPLMPSFSSPIPLSIYVHIPWCVKKCPYCDFNSHKKRQESLPEQEYIKALLTDLEQKLPSIWGRRIESIFIGGGTPILFSYKAIKQIIRGLRERLPLRPDTEITMEANPGTFEADKFSGFRDAGINRLSIGIQSFNDQHLKALGRIHGGNQALVAVEIARKAGFENLNIDLMFALPQQSLEQSLSDLSTAIDLNPEHLSFYQLTIEPNTEFHVKPPVTPSDDIAWEMQEQGQALLRQHGYKQYEVSAYARHKKTCRHNLNYWEFGDYLGIGAGAHGKITDSASGTVTRHRNYRQPAEYMKNATHHSAIQGSNKLSEDELRFEFMLNALRLTQGVQSQLYIERTGLPLDSLSDALSGARDAGLMEKNLTHLAATSRGQQYLNEVILKFMD